MSAFRPRRADFAHSQSATGSARSVAAPRVASWPRHSPDAGRFDCSSVSGRGRRAAPQRIARSVPSRRARARLRRPAILVRCSATVRCARGNGQSRPPRSASARLRIRHIVDQRRVCFVPRTSGNQRNLTLDAARTTISFVERPERFFESIPPPRANRSVRRPVVAVMRLKPLMPCGHCRLPLHRPEQAQAIRSTRIQGSDPGCRCRISRITAPVPVGDQHRSVRAGRASFFLWRASNKGPRRPLLLASFPAAASAAPAPARPQWTGNQLVVRSVRSIDGQRRPVAINFEAFLPAEGSACRPAPST